MRLKSVLLTSAACAYVAAGFVAYQIVVAITGDADMANWIVLGLALPLALPLSYALRRIEAIG